MENLDFFQVTGQEWRQEGFFFLQISLRKRCFHASTRFRFRCASGVRARKNDDIYNILNHSHLSHSVDMQVCFIYMTGNVRRKQESRAEHSARAEAGRPTYIENETGIIDLADRVSGAERERGRERTGIDHIRQKPGLPLGNHDRILLLN